MPYDYPTPPQAPKSNLPRPALGNPALERAQDALKRAYPRDMAGVDIQPDWGPLSETNSAAFVSPTEPNTIRINGLRSALAPQELIEGSAAHELEHVRQFRDPKRMEQLKQAMQTPYENRQHENEARDASQRYRAQRYPGTHDGIAPNIYTDVIEQNQQSPAVAGLLKWINRR